MDDRSGIPVNQPDLFGHRGARVPFRATPQSLAAPFSQPSRRKPGAIRVGTSGYSFADWVGPFYPHGTRSQDMLPFYQQHFSTVEINSTYYRIPPPRTLARMAERTPADFLFLSKLPATLTHQRERDLMQVRTFLAALAPLDEAGKNGGCLAQFPFSFRQGPASEDHLRWLREALGDTPLFVEFRHCSWDLPDLKERLTALGLGFCCVDEPSLRGLFPRRVMLSGDQAYVRFHGRNGREWWRGGPRRYDYLYTEAELEPWQGFVRDLAQQAKQTFVFFNNCHAGHAVINARMMEEILGLE